MTKSPAKRWPEDQPSLRSWHLRSLKSVVSVDVDLAPLTVLAGENSAGKSTLLQSILLTAQSATESTEGLFPLNGALVRLGTYDETVSETARTPEDLNPEIVLGGSMTIPPEAGFMVTSGG